MQNVNAAMPTVTPQTLMKTTFPKNTNNVFVFVSSNVGICSRQEIIKEKNDV